jgi:molybdenum cofactor biosynthesis enzyme MoaA
MPSVPLPIYTQRPAPADLSGRSLAVDRRKPYPSCQWLEGGLAFDWRSVHACLVIHHNRGFPFLGHFNGGALDIRANLAARARIIRENQNGGHEACRGCPNLVTRKWPRPRYPFRLLGIAQFAHCNIECSYCYLHWQDPAVYEEGNKPYAVTPVILNLIRQRLLDPRATIDWGGGEPTIYREFDEVLRLLTRRGAVTFVHTNGTRLPAPIREGLSTKRIHIICSVDAGRRETWEHIKKKDLLEVVWKNLEQYIRYGCRVILKYIMMPENCSEPELRAFLSRALRIGARELVLDIDYTKPDCTPEVLHGLRYLKHKAIMNGLHVAWGSTGVRFAPELDNPARLDCTWQMPLRHRLEFKIRTHSAEFARHARNVARRLR